MGVEQQPDQGWGAGSHLFLWGLRPLPLGQASVRGKTEA